MAEALRPLATAAEQAASSFDPDSSTDTATMLADLSSPVARLQSLLTGIAMTHAQALMHRAPQVGAFASKLKASTQLGSYGLCAAFARRQLGMECTPLVCQKRNDIAVHQQHVAGHLTIQCPCFPSGTLCQATQECVMLCCTKNSRETASLQLAGRFASVGHQNRERGVPLDCP